MDAENHPQSMLNSHLIPIPGTAEDGRRRCWDKTEVIAELKMQIGLAGPLVVVSILQYSLQMISLMFIGHLGESSLSGAAMATSFAGVTGFCFLLGMGSALETLCGQAYGAKQYHMLGVHTRRAMFIITLISIPISALWIYTEQILLFFKQDPQISMYAGNYILWLIPSILPFGLLQCQFRFLQTQSIVFPLMASTAMMSLTHVLVCPMLIFTFGFGYKGAALSNAISYWANVLVLAVYINFSSACKKTWTSFSKEVMEDPLGFLKLGIPSALMVCLGFWAFEGLVLMSGLLPNPKLETSVMSISLSTNVMLFRIPNGFGSAVSTRVSNELGAGRAQAARWAAQVVIFLVVVEAASLNLILFALRGVWGYMYTNDEQVATYLASVLPVLAIANFMDAMQAVFSGIARGCGWQKLGAFVNLGAYYFVGIPAAIVMTFVFHLGGKGLWGGIILGSSLQATLLMIITMRTDWEEQVKMARDRVLASNFPKDN